jgi:hypothetical protein
VLAHDTFGHAQMLHEITKLKCVNNNKMVYDIVRMTGKVMSSPLPIHFLSFCLCQIHLGKASVLAHDTFGHANSSMK